MSELLNELTGVLQATLHSPWLWVAVLLIAGLDALLPFMPSETTVVTVAVLLGSQVDQLVLLVVVAALGAFAGDCLGHAIGRRAGPSVIRRLQRGPRGEQRYEWARKRVDRHAPMLIVAARYLPGGRVASGLATGSMRYPWRRFLILDAIGSSVWATYSVLLGFIGGASFAGEPIKGLLLAFALALAVVFGIEIGRRYWPRWRARARGRDTPASGAGAREARRSPRTRAEVSEVDTSGADGSTPGAPARPGAVLGHGDARRAER